MHQFMLSMVALSFAFTAFASPTEKNPEMFEEMFQQRQENGNKVLQSVPKQVVQESTPFKSPFQVLVEKQKDYLLQDAKINQVELTEDQAYEQASTIVQDNIVKIKDGFRTGKVFNLQGEQVMESTVLCNDNGTTEACMDDEDLAGKRPSNENIRWFFPNNMSYTKDIREMKVSAAIEEDVQPWSDDYWAIQGGVLGHRYADYEASGYSWDNSLNYVLSQEGHISKILNMPEGDEKKNAIDKLSPSEKFDLLIATKDDILNPAWLQWTDSVEYSNGMRLFGQVGGYLTPQQWAQGQPYFDRDGSVESWMGICHGWAAAAIQMPRPKNAIELTAADGKTKITFYPSEIKSFGSYLWANSAPRNSRFIGGRCNDKEVEYDEESGAVIDETCFDTNPADWHAIVSAYLGRHKQSFVMDMTFDYEVWNQPVLSYDVHFSNPMSDTWETSENVMDMVVPYDEAFKAQDPFKNIRNASSQTRYIVNVGMEVKYLSENSPEARGTDGPQYDNVVETYYSYDLELDANYNVIGGEWHSNEHPDFLWTYDAGQKAYAADEKNFSEDSVIANINMNDPSQPFLSLRLQEESRKSAVKGEIWGAVVRAMFEKANQ